MLASIALLVAAQGAPITFPSFLSGFKDEGGREFNTWKGFPSEFQRSFIGHRPSARVAAEAKRQLDPQLWEQGPTFGWHNVDGSNAEPCSNWAGRKGTIVEGWSVDIDWDWGPIGRTGERYGHAPGWTHVAIHAQCQKEDVPRIRETFRFLFGVP